MPGWCNGQHESLWNFKFEFDSQPGYQKMNKENKLVPGLPSGFEDRWDKKLLLKKKLLKAIENNFIKFGAEALETPSFEISENIGSFLAEDGIRDSPQSRGLGDVYKRQLHVLLNKLMMSLINGYVIQRKVMV